MKSQKNKRTSKLNKTQQLKRWVKIWIETGLELDRIRKEEIQNSNPEDTIITLGLAFKSAIKHNPPKPYSGLVEQQRLFSKMRS